MSAPVLSGGEAWYLRSAMAPELKMWIVVRSDLDMSTGKACAQAGHAVGRLHLIANDRDPEKFSAYISDAAAKITVRADSEHMLLRVEREAVAANLPACLVRDAGRSELPPGTATACAFGPAYHEELPSFLRRLRVL